MPGRSPSSRMTRLFVVLAATTGLAGLLAMHGLAPAHGLLALGQLHNHASPVSMSQHGEPESAASATRGAAIARPAGEMPSTRQINSSSSGRLVTSDERGLALGAAQAADSLDAGAMSHGATGACLAILGAGLLVAALRRRSGSWPTSAALKATVPALAVHAVRALRLRCRAPSHLEFCVWRT